MNTLNKIFYLYVNNVKVWIIVKSVNIVMSHKIEILTFLRFKQVVLKKFFSSPSGPEASGPQLLPVRALNEVFIGESLSSRYF